MSLALLNQRFALDNQLEVIKGKNGIPFIKIQNTHASAIISLLGAHVLSYSTRDANDKTEDELLYLSPKSEYKVGKAIRGGIPICWPWFGDDPENLGRQAHGFARNVLWELAETKAPSDENTEVSFILKASEASKALWPHDFILTLTVRIGKTLSLALTTQNTGNKSFTIQQALHTYFSVRDIKHTKIQGLDKIFYFDKVLADKSSDNVNYPPAQQQGDILIKQEVDRIYENTSNELLIIDDSNTTDKRKISIQSTGSKTSVVWNPWKAISIAKNDFNDDAYRHFICVETVNTRDDSVVLQPNEAHTIQADYSLN